MIDLAQEYTKLCLSIMLFYLVQRSSDCVFAHNLLRCAHCQPVLYWVLRTDVQVPTVEMQIIVQWSGWRVCRNSICSEEKCCEKVHYLCGVKGVSRRRRTMCCKHRQQLICLPQQKKNHHWRRLYADGLGSCSKSICWKPQFPSKQWTDAGTLSPTRFNG